MAGGNDAPPIVIITGYALAALVGITLGLMGGGGSILTVPIFVYVMGYDAKLAIAMSLPVIGATSLVGALTHWRAGNVHLRTAATFGVLTMVGAFAGARTAALLSGAAQLALLASMMLIAAIMMLRSASQPSATATTAPRAMPMALLIPVALAIGIVTGLVGVGGGFLVVPALVLIARASMKQAIGTSLLVIAMNSASAFAGYVGQVQVPWVVVAVFTAIAVCGIILGSWGVRFVAQRTLKQVFAVLLIMMGSFMLYRSRSVLWMGMRHAARFELPSDTHHDRPGALRRAWS